MIVKYNICLKTFPQQDTSEPVFYGDLVYKFQRIVVGRPNFCDQFKKIIKRYKRVGYSMDVMRQSTCQAVNPITVDSYAFLFNCTAVGQASDRLKYIGLFFQNVFIMKTFIGIERTGCFALFVFFLLCDYKCSASLSRGTMGWSMVCDCDIS